MELAQILRTLLSHKWLLVPVAILGVIAAISTSYRITRSGLEKRSFEFGAAQTQVLVDSPRSSLIDLTQETPPLATRAAVYAQFMRSNVVKQEIAKEVGVPADRIVAQGPFTTAGGTQNIPRPSEARSNEIRGERNRYRLVFDYTQDLPIISIYAQAPTAAEAIKLANGTVSGVRRYVASLEKQQDVPEGARTQIRELGAADGGVVNAGVNKIMMVLAFIAVMIAGCTLIVVVVSMRRGFQRAADVWRAEEEAETLMYEIDPSVSDLFAPASDGDGADREPDNGADPERRRTRSWTQ
jgi:capsular polysaccharide biosynthesis protein